MPQASSQVKCYHSHPAYPVTDEYVIYGGSGQLPIVDDAHVYVALDSGWHPTQMTWPWKEGEAFLFSIDNYRAPKNVAEFKSLIEYLAVQLAAGKKVHVGCIGGHGRTGLVFAALRKHMANDDNAIAHVRTHYCKKGVETKEQMDWLAKHWGISLEGIEAVYKGFDHGKGAVAAKSAREFFDDDGNGSHLDVRGGSKKPKPRVEGCTRSETLGCWNDGMCKSGHCNFLQKGVKGAAKIKEPTTVTIQHDEPLADLVANGETPTKRPRAEIRMATADEIEAAKKPIKRLDAEPPISWNSKSVKA